MLCTLETLILILLGVGRIAFVTLLERKILGLTQIRLGPNKVSITGILQPLADGIKLLAKQILYPNRKQNLFFILSPSLLLFLFLLLWTWGVPWESNERSFKYNSLLLFSLLGAGAYSVILTGWASIRVFTKLGRIRGILQRLSYEVALILIFLIALFLLKRMHFSGFPLNKEILRAWAVLWFLLVLMERNRAPFDLLEGERELIRGFNTETGSLVFVILFLSEYGILTLLRTMFCIVVFSFSALWARLFACGLLLIRRCFPRARYDSLMTFIWQAVLPLGLLLNFPGLWI